MSYGEIYKTTWWGNPTPEGWGNSYFDKYFKPLQITGLKLWSYAEVDPRPSWNVTGFQLNNEADATTNLKSKTGGYYVANFATGDYVDIPEITLTGDFSYHAFLEVSTSALAYGLLGNSANDEQGIFINTSNQVSVRIGSTTYASTLSAMSNGFHLVQIVRNGSNLLVYVDGVYIETLTVSTNDVVLNGVGIYNSLYFSTTIKDLSLFNTALTASQISNLYNNPQRFVELSREYGAERIYDFNIGNGEVGYSVWDLSGNDQHGTIQSNLAPAGTNFIYNDAEVGTQQVLESRNTYYWFDGVDDQIIYTSHTLANATVEIRLLYTSGEQQFVQLSDTGNTNRYIGVTFNSNVGLAGTIGITTLDATTLGAIPNKCYYTNQSIEVGSFITLYLSFDASGNPTPTINGITFIPSSAGQSRVDTTLGQNVFYLAKRGAGGFFYSGIIDYFKFNSSINSYNHTGFEDGTINGSPQSIFIPESTTKGIDLFGNAITNKWNQGLLNFTGLDLVDNAHGGVEFGDQVDTLDVSNGRVIVLVVKRKSNGIDQNLLANRNTDDGFRLSISDAANKVAFINEVGGVAVPKSTTNLILEDELYFIGILQKPSGDLTIWLEDLNNEISTGENFTSLGSIGLGSLIPTIGIKPNKVSNPFNGVMTSPILYDKSSISLAEINNLRKYLKSLIS